MISFFMAAMSLAQLAVGNPDAVGISRSGLSRINALMQAEVHPGGVSAASILIARSGTVVLHKGYGVKVEPDSVYIVASITKPVTATALMLLVERGKVSLSDPVSTYLPEFTGGERDKAAVCARFAHAYFLPACPTCCRRIRSCAGPMRP